MHVHLRVREGADSSARVARCRIVFGGCDARIVRVAMPFAVGARDAVRDSRSGSHGVASSGVGVVTRSG